MSWAIEGHGLTKRFKDLVAVDHVDLEIAQDELFGLLGPNGAGKTTLIRMLTGLTGIGEGSARVAGVDVVREPDRLRRSIGVVPQALTSDLDLTGWENLDIHARFFDMPRASRHRRVQELLERVELWDRRDDLVSTYSGGMRRRLEIARGLIHRPPVLFLDEPTIGLDPQSRHVIWELLRELRRGGGLTVSLTTHYLDEAEALCDRVAIVDHGKLVALGTPTELKARVPGSDTIELAFAAPPSEELRAQLQRLEGVRQVERREQRLLVRADGGAALLPRVIELAVARGEHPSGATLTRISLEDVFISVTGHQLRDARVSSTEGRRAAAARAFGKA